MEAPDSPAPAQQHALERVLSDSRMRSVLRFLTRPGNGQGTMLERMLWSFENPSAPLWDRLRFYPLHATIEHVLHRRDANMEMARFKFFHHRPTLRALVNAARSVSTYGLTQPQKFVMPLMVVWNFTQACNLKCIHCYQDATAKALPDELTLEQKLHLVDEMADQYVPFLALAGGEPLMGRHFWEVLRHCQKRGIHVTVASNGTTLTRDVTARLVDHGVKYVEVSVDSVSEEKHDSFRGIPGAWKRTIEGIRNVVATPGLRAGMAACISRMNADEIDDMVQLAIDLGCATFVHFNYIPVGRGQGSDIHDLAPDQREEVLRRLGKWMNSGRIGVMSTAPQLGRACMMYGELEDRMAIGHAGSSPGGKVRVLARYVGGCGSARCYCSVQPNGDVTPCVYIPHRVLGNVKEKTLREIWEKSEYFQTLTDRDNLKGHCRTCDYRSYCGGCRARAEAYFEDILEGDPGCILNRPLWDKVSGETQVSVDS